MTHPLEGSRMIGWDGVTFSDMISCSGSHTGDSRSATARYLHRKCLAQVLLFRRLFYFQVAVSDNMTRSRGNEYPEAGTSPEAGDSYFM